MKKKSTPKKKAAAKKPNPVPKKKIRKRPVKGGNDRDPDEDARDEGDIDMNGYDYETFGGF